jgi:hypothetical protein
MLRYLFKFFIILLSSYLEAGFSMYCCCVNPFCYSITDAHTKPFQDLEKFGFSDSPVLLERFGDCHQFKVSTNLMRILRSYNTQTHGNFFGKLYTIEENSIALYMNEALTTGDFIVKLYPLEKNGVQLYIRICDDFKRICLSTNSPLSGPYNIQLLDGTRKKIFLYVYGEPFVEYAKNAALVEHPGIEVLQRFNFVLN